MAQLRMRFGILGPLEVWTAGGQFVDLGRPKARAVLAMLVIEANQVVSLDRIVEQLWGDEAPPRAAASLHSYISNLRRALEPERERRGGARVLVSRAPGYYLAVEPTSVDAFDFEARVDRGRSALAVGDANTASDVLREALSLWRGPALVEFADEPFAQPAAIRLEELRATAFEDLVDAELLLDHHGGLIGELEARVAAAPLRERLWGQLMVALYRSGRQGDALRAYQRARAVLADELGVEPGHALQDLERAILDHADALSPPRPAALSVAPNTRVNGVDTAPLGREVELAVADAVLADVQQGGWGGLLFVGEPGIGKTMVADEVARRARAKGFVVAAGRCPEDVAVAPLWPWTRVLRDLFDAARLDPPPDLVAFVERGEMPAETASLSRLFDAAIDYVRRYAMHVPMFVTIDDVQWADTSSLHLLELMVDSIGGVPVAVAVTMRDLADDAVRATRERLARRAAVREIVLSGLSEGDVDALVHRVAGAAAASGVARVVRDRTAGNPFFATELVRLLAAERRLDDVNAATTSNTPGNVRDVVRRRLARLPQQTAAVLTVAAVIGPDVDVRLLAAVTELGLDEVVDMLDLAGVTDVVAERVEEPGSYRFAHDLVREAIVEVLPGLRRAKLHEQIADAIVSTYGDDPRQAHELARHAVAAAPRAGVKPAIPRLVRSARVYLDQLAPREGACEMTRALALAQELLPSPERSDIEALVRARLASTQLLLDDVDPQVALEQLRAARQGASGHDVAALGEVLISVGAYAGLFGDIAASIAAGEELIDLGREHGDEILEANGHYAATFKVWTGAIDEALAHIERSIALAESLLGRGVAELAMGVPIRARHALHGHALAVAGHDTRAREALARATTAGSSAEGWSAAWSHAFAAAALGHLRDAAAVSDLAAAHRATSNGLRYTDAVVGAYGEWADMTIGRTPFDATALATRRAVLAATGDRLFRAPVAILHAEQLAAVGDERDASALRTEAEVHASGIGQLLFGDSPKDAPIFGRGGDTHQCPSGTSG